MSITVSDLIIGERFNMKGQDERLEYVGVYASGGTWYQFAIIGDDTICAMAREIDLNHFEKTEES